MGIGELVLVAGTGAVSGICKLALPSVTSNSSGTSHAERGFDMEKRERTSSLSQVTKIPVSLQSV